MKKEKKQRWQLKWEYIFTRTPTHKNEYGMKSAAFVFDMSLHEQGMKKKKKEK